MWVWGPTWLRRECVGGCVLASLAGRTRRGVRQHARYIAGGNGGRVSKRSGEQVSQSVMCVTKCDGQQ